MQPGALAALRSRRPTVCRGGPPGAWWCFGSELRPADYSFRRQHAFVPQFMVQTFSLVMT